MIKHISKQIHDTGLNYFIQLSENAGYAYERRQSEVIQHWVEIKSPQGNRDFYPMQISVKPYTYKYETKVTGMNLARIGKLVNKQKELHRGIYAIFVDAKAGLVYGNFLAVLNKPVMDRSVKFPIEQNAGGQMIRYWSVDRQMKTIFQLTQLQKETLLDMHVENGQDMSQIKLFS